MEYSEEVYNEQVRDKTETWYFEDVGKVGDTGTNFDFVGTILHRDSLLSKLTRNPAYDSKIYQAITSWSEREDLWNEWRRIYTDWDNQNRLADACIFYSTNEKELLRGTGVLWPEKETYLDHMKDMVEIGRRAFMKEKQNDPQGATDAVFGEFHWYKEEAEGYRILSTGKLLRREDVRQWIAATDPATGKKRPKVGAEGDFAVILAGFTDHLVKDRVWIHHDWTKRAPPSKQIQELFALQERFGVEAMAIETNLYRELYLPNILAEKKRREKEEKKEIHVRFYEVEQTENKLERITAVEPKVTHGKIMLNVSLSQVFKTQLEDFPRNSHDDCPDAMEMLYSLANGRYKAGAVHADAMAGR